MNNYKEVLYFQTPNDLKHIFNKHIPYHTDIQDGYFLSGNMDYVTYNILQQTIYKYLNIDITYAFSTSENKSYIHINNNTIHIIMTKTEYKNLQFRGVVLLISLLLQTEYLIYSCNIKKCISKSNKHYPLYQIAITALLALKNEIDFKRQIYIHTLHTSKI